ncbi:MAG TPA: SPOR domain-containing protein [Bryobacteraceae bacterium]|jgi:cell division septation protein DedD|nr:SPOR domain-containing protein [Bryobacteraceae bacterium]
MKNNETGEFELVLGNRQLLSGFFIVVILFAVFFVMGYIVGRNSTPQLAASRDPSGGTAVASGARPQPASGSAPGLQSPPAAEPPKDDAGANPTASEPQPATQAAQAPAPKTEPPAPVTPAAPAAVESTPGETYLQVTAVKQDVAETVARTLKDKGFPAVLSPGPAGKTRVLVGPYADLSKLGQAKAELERLGFSPFVKR